MNTELQPDDEPTAPLPSAVPLILVRPFKSLLRTSIYIKHRRHRRSDYFISMNDHCACIPPGTPISMVSRRTTATTESNVTSSPLQSTTQEDNDASASVSVSASVSATSRLDKTTESVSDAGACGTIETWSLLSLPTMQKSNHVMQFAPSQDVSTDDDILRDIVYGGTAASATTDFLIHSTTPTKDEGAMEHQTHRLVMRPLLVGEEIPQVQIRIDNTNPLDMNSSRMDHLDSRPTCADDSGSKADRSDEIPDILMSQQVDDGHIPDVPVIKSLMCPSMLLQALTLEESNAPNLYDINIPKEIICYAEEMDDDLMDTNHEHESKTVNTPLLSPCILPCPKDQPFRRRPRRFSDPKDSGPETEASEMSLFDIICRHQHISSLPPSEEEQHMLPVIIIEVDRRKQLPPKNDQRQRRRSRATRHYQRRWQRTKDGKMYPTVKDGKMYPTVDQAPDYASV